jgi:hypothetical protein
MQGTAQAIGKASAIASLVFFEDLHILRTVDPCARRA